MIRIRKIDVNHSQRDEYTAPLRRMWETLATYAGKRDEDKISPEEYLAARERSPSKELARCVRCVENR